MNTMQDLTPVVIDSQPDFELRLHAEMMMHGPHCSLNHWDVSNLYTMVGLFESSKFDGDISKWNVSHVDDMSAMFLKSAFTGQHGSLNAWNVKNVTDFQNMFYGSSFAGDVSAWTISPYLVKDGLRLFATRLKKPNTPTLRLPMQEHVAITELFAQDTDAMNAWLSAQAKEGRWSRYHWDALVAGMASTQWANAEMMEYAKAGRPILQSLGSSPIQIAKSLQQSWATHDAPSPGITMAGLV